MSKAKQDAILSYVHSHANDEISTSDLAKATGVSLPTILTFIKNNGQYFTKVKHGVYRIEACEPTVTVVTNVIATVLPSAHGAVGAPDPVVAVGANGPAATVYPSPEANAAIAAALGTTVIAPSDPLANLLEPAETTESTTNGTIARPFEW